jgi:hypothetical protein
MNLHRLHHNGDASELTLLLLGICALAALIARAAGVWA